MGTPLQGFDADVWVTPSSSVAASNENCTDSGDHITYTAGTHKYWDKAVAVVIQQSANGSSGWSTVPTSEYTWQAVGGKLVFTPARVPATNTYIRINTGSYLVASQCGDSNTWSLSLAADTADTTTFQSAWRLKTVTVKGGSIKIDNFQVDDLLSKELGNKLICILYADKSVGSRWECYAVVTGVAPKASAIGVIEQSLDLAIDGEAYYLAS